jgi:ComF family protein
VNLFYIQKLIDLVLPPRCPITGEMVDSQGTVSAQAWKDLSFISSPCCFVCGFPFEFIAQIGDNENVCAACLLNRPEYDKSRSALVYNEYSRDFILGFKHGDQTQSVVAMVPWLYQAGAGLWPEVDVIAPVPLHRWRLLRRRYNQSVLMGRAISKRVGISFSPDILIRKRHTVVQGHLNASERHKNVASAFTVHPKRKNNVLGKTIMLIDDVYTTGSTVNECARVLKKAGADKVYVLTLARVVRPQRG